MSGNTQRPSEVLAEQVRAWRDRRGLSARQLAERIADLGGSMDRVAIASLEVGRRGVSLDEALLLAVALNVPPPLLMFGLGTGDLVEITTADIVDPQLATEWLAGEEPLAASRPVAAGDDVLRPLREWDQAAEPLRMYREHAERQAAYHATHRQLLRARYTGDEVAVVEARAALAPAVEALHDHLRVMQQRGVTPPVIGEATVTEMREVGLDVTGLPVGEDTTEVVREED